MLNPRDASRKPDDINEQGRMTCGREKMEQEAILGLLCIRSFFTTYHSYVTDIAPERL
jgi:hypothetical protein